MNRICVYCGSSTGHDPSHAQAARRLADRMAARALGLVYGGASVGLMGIVADQVIECGGEAIGVIPASLMDREIGHDGLTQLHVVDSMHERKALMAELADGFIALPGGLGTLEETFEILTWAQLGLHHKPVGLLDSGGYFQHLSAFLDHAVAEGFVRPEHRRMILVDDDPDRLLDRMAHHRPPAVAKWIDATET